MGRSLVVAALLIMALVGAGIMAFMVTMNRTDDADLDTLTIEPLHPEEPDYYSSWRRENPRGSWMPLIDADSEVTVNDSHADPADETFELTFSAYAIPDSILYACLGEGRTVCFGLGHSASLGYKRIGWYRAPGLTPAWRWEDAADDYLSFAVSLRQDGGEVITKLNGREIGRHPADYEAGPVRFFVGYAPVRLDEVVVTTRDGRIATRQQASYWPYAAYFIASLIVLFLFLLERSVWIARGLDRPGVWIALGYASILIVYAYGPRPLAEIPWLALVGAVIGTRALSLPLFASMFDRDVFSPQQAYTWRNWLPAVAPVLAGLAMVNYTGAYISIYNDFDLSLPMYAIVLLLHFPLRLSPNIAMQSLWPYVIARYYAFQWDNVSVEMGGMAAAIVTLIVLKIVFGRTKAGDAPGIAFYQRESWPEWKRALLPVAVGLLVFILMALDRQHFSYFTYLWFFGAAVAAGIVPLFFRVRPAVAMTCLWWLIVFHVVDYFVQDDAWEVLGWVLCVMTFCGILMTHGVMRGRYVLRPLLSLVLILAAADYLLAVGNRGEALHRPLQSERFFYHGDEIVWQLQHDTNLDGKNLEAQYYNRPAALLSHYARADLADRFDLFARGYVNSYQALVYFQELVLPREHKPKYVVLFIGRNERRGALARLMYPKLKTQPTQPLGKELLDHAIDGPRWLPTLLHRSSLARWRWRRQMNIEAENYVRAMTETTVARQPQNTIEPTDRQVLERFVDLGREHGIEMIFVPYPTLHGEFYDPFHAGLMREVAQAKGAVFVDLREAVREYDEPFLDPLYLSGRAYEIISLELMKVVYPLIDYEPPPYLPYWRLMRKYSAPAEIKGQEE